MARTLPRTSTQVAIAFLSGCAGYTPPISTPTAPLESDLGEGMPAELVVPLGHDGPVQAVAVTADGKLAASAGSDGTVRIWELSSARELRVLRNARASALELSPDARLVAIGGDALMIAKVSTGELVHTIRTAGPIRSVAFGKSGSLVGAAVGSTVELYEVASGEPLGSVVLESAVGAIAFAPDRALLATGEASGDVTLFDLGTGEKLATLGSWISRLFGLGTHEADVTGLAFSPDGSWLASVSSNGEMIRTDVLTLDVRGEAKATDARGVSVSPDGRLVLVTCDGAVEAFDVPTDRSLFRSLVSGARSARVGSGLIVVAGKELSTLDATRGAAKDKLIGHASPVHNLGFLPSRWILGGTAGTGLFVLDAGAGATSVLELPGTSAADRAAGELRFVLGADGLLALLEAGAAGQKAAVIEWATGAQKAAFPEDASAVELVDLAASPNGRLAATLGTTGIAIHELRGGRELIRFSVDRAVSKGSKLAYSSDGNRLAAIIDLRVRVYDSVEGRLVWRDARTATDLVYSGDDELLVASGPDGVALFAAGDGKERGVLGHLDTTAVAASRADSRRLASGDSRGEIRVYDAKEAIERFRIERAHRGPVRALRFDDTRGILISSGEDATVAFFRASDGRELFRVTRVGREDFLVTAPDGRFDLSETTGNRAYVVRGAKSFDARDAKGRTNGLLATLLQELSAR
ncbi:MAG: hypothetical protein HYV07_24615 [Deltaproteobacteria bacterium]|nr:hypothetical protein [Deltaproteobacteria bacterium]